MQLLTLDYTETRIDTLGEKVLKHLANHGGVVVRRFPDDDDSSYLLDFAQRLGEVRPHIGRAATTRRNSNRPALVYHIRARERPMRNSRRQTITSQTSSKFRLHTDQYFQACVPDTVVLLCCEADEHGEGRSLIAHVDDVVRRLRSADIEELEMRQFPHPSQAVSILTRVDGAWHIRYNWDYIGGQFRALNNDVSQAAAVALRNLYHAAEESVVDLLLSPNECLILDNYRTLHGRRDFSPDSRRVFKRVRVDRQALKEKRKSDSIVNNGPSI